MGGDGSSGLRGMGAGWWAGPGVGEAEVRGFEARVPGLSYWREYIGAAEERRLLRWVDGQAWLTDIRRRTQHHGWKYDYKARVITPGMRLGDLPGPLAALAQRLHAEGRTTAMPDQVIINEYLPGQGIAPHVDRESCLGDTVFILSLGAGSVLEFAPRAQGRGAGGRKAPKQAAAKVPVWLLPRSLVRMQGDARYRWAHGIPARKSDIWRGQRCPRGRRVSLTFRKVEPV